MQNMIHGVAVVEIFARGRWVKTEIRHLRYVSGGWEYILNDGSGAGGWASIDRIREVK
jgi:hypothetical protein